MALPKIVKEDKRDVKERVPPDAIILDYFPGKSDISELKMFLEKYL